MSVNILEVPLQPSMTIQEAVYIRAAIKSYCKSCKNPDEKDLLLLWLRQLDNFLCDKAILSSLPDSF